MYEESPELPDFVTPQKLIEFAMNNGWFEFRVRSKGIRVFQQWEGTDFHQITVPLDPTFSDYKRAMLLACRQLAERAGLRFETTSRDFSWLKS